jgi:hypothetical protein
MIEFSFLLPTRGRPELVNRFFQSILDTTHRIEDIEIVLCLDDDDLASPNITHHQLSIKKVILPKGATMGSLNRACFNASSGRYVMLINDDVIIRTKNWDQIIARIFLVFQDDIALIHVNDLLFRERLCTFPILSRRACLEIGICPDDYKKYRIDDHIYDTYNILAHLGHKRIIYLPDVVFEHDMDVRKQQTEKLIKVEKTSVHLREKEAIAFDTKIFDERIEERKQNALRLASLIDKAYENNRSIYMAVLSNIKDPYSYRRSNFVKKIGSNLYNSLSDLVYDHTRWRYGEEKFKSQNRIGNLEMIGGSNDEIHIFKILPLIRSNRFIFRLVYAFIHNIAKVFNRYYFHLPLYIRKVADRLISKLLRIYRAIQYSRLPSEK